MAVIFATAAVQAGAATTDFVVGLNFPPLALTELADPVSTDLDPTLAYPVLDDISSVEIMAANDPETSPENRVAEYIDSRTETLRGLLNLLLVDVNLIPLFFVNRSGEDTTLSDGTTADPAYMRGHLDMGGFRIVDTTDAVNAQDLGTIQQVEAVQFSAEDDIEQILDTQLIRRDGTIVFGADFNMGASLPHRIFDLDTPTLAGHLQTKDHFDAQVTTFRADRVARTGGNPMSGDLDMREDASTRHKVINVGAPTVNSDLTNLFYLNQQVAIASPQGVPVGAIIQYSAFFSQLAGLNFLVCNGQEVSRTIYANLFTVIGTLYGTPSGSGVFKLPDLRGRTPLGLDNMGGLSANVVTDPDADALSTRFGNELQILATDELPIHDHDFDDTVSATGSGAVTGSTDEDSDNPTSSDSDTTDTAGTGAGHQNVQPSMAVTYVIRF